MDFGKKGDAKRAMRLHHKEGITLKQAWKRVKGKSGHSKKSKKGSMSPKKKRAVANAKKAMKLKWKEGISLKQAWKKVNKFGDTVCPPGYEPNVMWSGGKGQMQCIKQCGFYQMRDPMTNRCKNMTMVKQGSMTGVSREVPPGMEINPETGRLRKMCVPPQVRNPMTKRCKNPVSNVVPPDMERNPETGRLRKMCVPPQVRNPMTKRCKNPVSSVVPPDMERNPETGRLRKICQVGYYRDPVTGRCRRIRTELQPLIAPPFAGQTLMDFGKYRRRKSGFGKVTMCGFGSCKTCAMR